MAYIDDAPRVAETTTTTGTGPLTLAGAYDASRRTFASVCSTSDTVPYFIVADDDQWEHGKGTYSAANELTRTTVYASSNAGSVCTLTAGTKVVFLGDPGTARSLLFAASKTTPVSADRFALMDSADSNKLKHVTFANLVAALGAPPTSGGTVDASGSVTLTNASSQAHKLAPTANGDYVKLPDATTMTEGGSLFVLGNPTPYWVRVIDSTSVIRGFIPPGCTVSVSLADNGTAAGGWSLNGAALFGVTATYRSSTQGYFKRAQFHDLGTSRTLIVVCTGNGSGAGAFKAVVHDASDNTWGTLTTIRTLGSGMSERVNSLLLSTDFALVVSSNNGTELEAVTLSISGKTITVNTAGTATAAGTVSMMGDIVLLGTSAVFSYHRSTTTTALRAVTISGTAATIGAEVATSTSAATPDWHNAAHLYAVTSSIVLAIGVVSNSAAGYAKPYTLSGSTLTLGTGTTFGTATGGPALRTLSIGSRWMVMWCEGAGGSTMSAAVISVSGTTASLTSVTSVFTGLGAEFNVALVVDAQRISSSKVLVVGRNATVLRTNLLVDTAGTISKGTEYDPDFASQTWTSATIVSVTGNDARLYLPAVAGLGLVVTLDCSGTSPVATYADYLTPAANPAYPSYSKEVTAHPSMLKCGLGWASILSAPITAVSLPIVVGATEAFVLPTPAPFIFQPSRNDQGAGTFNQTARISDYAAWHSFDLGTNPPCFTLNKIEGAQP
jgi:hypothetical protein